MKIASLTMCLLVAASGAFGQSCGPGFGAGEPGASGIAGSFSAYVQPMTIFNNRLIIGGSFSEAGPFATNIIASFDPSTQAWSRVGGNVSLGNTSGFAAALATFPLGETPNLILGGFFASVFNGTTSVAETASLASWDGTSWSAMGTGWTPTDRGSVWTLLDWQPSPGVRRLVVGGGWSSIGTATANGIAYFDGETWQNIGGPNDTGINGPFSPVVFASAIYQGQLYIAGRFATTNGVSTPLVARWNGTVWQRVGALTALSSVSDVSALYVYDNGTGPRLYAGGYEMSVGGQSTSTAVWNGATWLRVGQNLGGRCTSYAAFNDGTGLKLYCGLTADAQQRYFYRLEGTTWVPVAGGMSVPLTGNFPSVFGMLATGDSLYVGGDFQIAGTVPSYGIAEYRASSNGPSITSVPASANACRTQSVEFSVSAASLSPITYQWRKNALVIDPSTNTSAATSTLRLSNVQINNVGTYDCIVTDLCGSVTSPAATLSICPADFDCSGGVDSDDVIGFFAAWDAGDRTADFNDDGGVDADDVIAFFGRWDNGC